MGALTWSRFGCKSPVLIVEEAGGEDCFENVFVVLDRCSLTFMAEMGDFLSDASCGDFDALELISSDWLLERTSSLRACF